MKIVKKNSGSFLLKLLLAIEADRTGWHAFYFMPVDIPGHEDMIKPPQYINGRLHKLNKAALALAGTLAKKSPPGTEGAAFIFPGGVVVVIVRRDLHALYADVAEKAQAMLTRLTDLNGDKVMAAINPWQKRMTVYDAIADAHKVQGIGFRRDRHKNGLILVADDDNFTGIYIANLLKNNYDLVIVRDGEDAVCAYIKHAPNLVLLDLHIPGMDGFTVLRTLRTIDSEARIIMITADKQDMLIFDAARAGAVGFLRKPLAKEKLLKTIGEAPGMRKFRSARQ